MMARPVFPDGGRIGLSDSFQDGGLTIRGGVTGITVQLEELTRGAEKLDDLAAGLARIETEAGRILDSLCRVQGVPPWSAAGHLAAVREGGWGVQAVRAAMQRISSQIRACIRDYETAEHRARAARATAAFSLEDFGKSVANLATAGALDDKAAQTLVAGLGLASPGLRAWIAREPWIRDTLMSLIGHFIPRSLEVKREETARVELDTSPAGLLERIRQIDARGAGSIEVLEVSGGGGPAYVVVIPGTQPAGHQAGGDNPFDEAGILEGMLYGSEEVGSAVLEALWAAGAEEGARVVVVGYSQGGMHAANLAADPRLLEEYDMKYVLTAGAPVAGMLPGEEVEALHLEHQSDWVPGSDGAPNPAARNRVTVSLATPLQAAAGEGGLGAGHGLTTYQEGARLVAASGDPALVQSTAVLASVLGAGGAATATRFTLTRTPGRTQLRFKPQPGRFSYRPGPGIP